MTFRINVFHHRDSDHEVLCKLNELLRKADHIMARVDELNAELIEINTTTNEMAADLDDLVARQQAGGLTDAEAVDIATKLAAHRDRLRELAAKHTPA